MDTTFKLAPMSPLIRGLTVFLLALPIVFLAIGIYAEPALAVTAVIMIALYLWVWLSMRPASFVVRPAELEVVWPLRRRSIPRADIATVRLIDRAELSRETGWAIRVGAGGLWGGFGWLWTQRRGRLQMYISRTDAFVLIERTAHRPWLITPNEPAAFLRALSTPAGAPSLPR